MRRTGVILSGVAGQSLSIRVPQGRPTSATVDVFRNYGGDDSTPEFSAVATVDGVSTTVSGPAGAALADPQRIPLASTAGVLRDGEYLISEGGLLERVVVIEVRTGYVRVRHPLVNSYTVAAVFTSPLLTAAVPDAWAADASKLSDLSDMTADYRARWSIVVAGVTVTAHSFFDVLRVEVRHTVDISDVNERAPGLKDSLPTEYRAESGRPLIDAAWRAVRAHFAAVSIDVNALRENEVLDELVILRSLQLLAEGGWRPVNADWAAYLKLVTDNYMRFFETHFAVTLKHRTQFQVGALPADAATANKPFWRK